MPRVKLLSKWSSSCKHEPGDILELKDIYAVASHVEVLKDGPAPEPEPEPKPKKRGRPKAQSKA